MVNSAIFQLMAEEVKLTIHIENKAPIELSDLASSFQAMADEFEAFASKDPDVRYPGEAKLFIKEIRHGSVIADLINYAPIVIPGAVAAVATAVAAGKPVVEAIGQINTVVKFAEHLKTGMEALFKGTKDKGKLEKGTLKNVSEILRPVAADPDAKINISTTNIHNGNIYTTINYNAPDCVRIRKQAGLELNKKEQPVNTLLRKQTLVFFQARNQVGNTSGDKGRIENISKKDVKIIFDDDTIKQAILDVPENLFKWAFVVDVEISYLNDRPIAYKVVQLHERFQLPEPEQDLL